MMDDVNHQQDPELIAQLEDKMAVYKYLFTQYNLRAGLKRFGQPGVDAAKNKLTQLHVVDTLIPEDPCKLPRIEKTKALSSLMFLKEKRNGKVKGRARVNGAPQRAYIQKEDATSPTVANKSTFIRLMIAAHEKRYIRYYDVPGAFLHTESDKNVLMILKGELADMMVRIALQIYWPYVTTDKKRTPILYVYIRKALYGLLRSSLLFYRN